MSKPRKQRNFPAGIPDLGRKKPKLREIKDVFHDSMVATTDVVVKMMNAYEAEFGDQALMTLEHKERFNDALRQLTNAPAAVLGGAFIPLFTHPAIQYNFSRKVEGRAPEHVGVFCVRNDMIPKVADFINSLLVPEEVAAGGNDDKGE